MSNVADINDNEVIVTWIDEKLKSTTRTICKFVLYLNYTRTGFIHHESPVIHLPIVKYIIEEIYDCSAMKLSTVTTSVPQNFIDNTRRYVAGYISTARLPMESIEHIWKYISYQVAIFLKDNKVSTFYKQVSKSQSSKQIAEATARVIEQAELNVTARQCPDTKLYKLDREIDGCILRSMVYVVVALMDWLELTNVTATEITFALDIILPADMQPFIVLDPPSTDFNLFKIAFVKEMNKHQLKITEDDLPSLEIMVATIHNILSTSSPDSSLYKRFSNRVRFFANTI